MDIVLPDRGEVEHIGQRVLDDGFEGGHLIIRYEYADDNEELDDDPAEGVCEGIHAERVEQVGNA